MKIRSPLLLNMGAWLASRIIRLLFSTVTIECHNDQPATDPRHPDCERMYLYSIWHESIVMPVAMCSIKNMAGLVSRHQDGGILAMTMKRFGIRAVRGSSSKGGTRALRELLTATQNWHITITPDGPRGPRREVKSGIIYLASQSGTPIVCWAFACQNAWVVRGNWTDMVVPKPFSKVNAFVAPPVCVPPNLDRAGIEHYRQRVQRVMEELDQKVARAGHVVPVPMPSEQPRALHVVPVPIPAERRRAA